MNLVKSANSDHSLINELFILGYNDNEMGYAFPRGDIKDVENELEVYGVNINDCFYIIKDGTNIIGTIGFLEVENDKGIIIGPVMYKNYYVHQNVMDSIKILLKNVDVKYSNISCDVLKENSILINVLKQNNFNLVSSHITMKLHLNNTFIKNDSHFKNISILNPQDKDRLIEIDNLFNSTLNDWANECLDSLYEYFEEGYKVAVVTENNLVMATIIWIWFEKLGYGRIEYIATRKTHQQKGYGGLLIDYVISELSKALTNDLENNFYLDLNKENEIAYKLYLKKGFEVQYQDYLFSVKRIKE